MSAARVGTVEVLPRDPVTAIPTARRMLWPALRGIDALGGSARISEHVGKVIELEGFTEEQQSIPHGAGPRSEIEYRLAWARTHLKLIGLLENSARGVWAITEEGQKALAAEPDAVVRRYDTFLRQRTRRLEPAAESLPGTADASSEESELSWEEELLAVLVELSPERFERLAQRLLREAGFTSVVVTGRSGDGGIDGTGVLRQALLGFPVFFQCKKYRGSVGPGAVRDFRGAMVGRGSQGILITTGTFTSDARREATRDGAPPIDLIDGEQLCSLLKQYGLGVKVELVEQVRIDREVIDAI